ncbi:MAG: MltA domain-containing protein [Zoogloeaceae bacterium]|jgi:membrane-bound lytic murein transglycosylase A|nr:MltA domain-containing protein [Zoogloeaceae bacterium]
MSRRAFLPRHRRFLPRIVLSLALLSSCSLHDSCVAPEPAPVQQAVCPPAPVCAPQAQATPPSTPQVPRLEAGTWDDLVGWREERFTEAWGAFRESCRKLSGREEGGADWRGVCAAAEAVDPLDDKAIRAFFEARFLPHAAVEADGRRDGLITGYYEPLIRGRRARDAQNTVPVLGVPADLLIIELGDLYPDLKHRRLRGRLAGNRVLPYWSREEIDARLETLPQHEWPGKPLLWVQDPVEFFYLQIQGSGRVELPDGSRVRIGYAEQNGHPYASIGRLLVEAGELKPEEASMQGIQLWGRTHPERLRALLNRNPSYVFFRVQEHSEGGPIGALGVPLTPGRSLAVDPRYIPLGAPVWLQTSYPNRPQPLRRLMLAQDTGGAIKGGARADFFWGFGKAAGEEAGRMRQEGRLWVLLPKAKEVKEQPSSRLEPTHKTRSPTVFTAIPAKDGRARPERPEVSTDE